METEQYLQKSLAIEGFRSDNLGFVFLRSLNFLKCFYFSQLKFAKKGNKFARGRNWRVIGLALERGFWRARVCWRARSR